MKSFIKRIRWKAFFFERQCEYNDKTSANFGFKSVKTPSKNDNLNKFESDLYDRAKNFEFKKVKYNFQIKLSNEVKNKKKNPKLLIPADETNNLYELTTEEYNKLLIQKISEMYKKTTVSAINAINTETEAIAKDRNLDERIEQYNQNKFFITLKEHKENFQNNLKCKLKNPAKSDIGIVSKQYIDQINKSIRERLNANQWRSTQDVITCFKNIKTKSTSSSIKFDTADVYPSISKDLLLKGINFAKSVTPIQDKFIKPILHSRKALLFNQNDVWVKKDNPDFDVTMGSYGGTEVCELDGLYILDIVTK